MAESITWETSTVPAADDSFEVPAQTDPDIDYPTVRKSIDNVESFWRDNDLRYGLNHCNGLDTLS